MTPQELNLYARAYGERKRVEEKATRASHYLLSTLIRTMVWAKRAPSYESVFPDDVERKDMTDEEIFAQVRALNALFGGEEVN